MPSDTLFEDLLRPARDPFHSALAHTIEEVRTHLDVARAGQDGQVGNAQAALGAFADGRVDASRFSALLDRTLTLDATGAKHVERAFEVLRSLNERFDSLCTVRVPAGGSLYTAVAVRLAEIGRAFGAARVVGAVRAGTYDEAEHDGLLEAWPFERWSAAERALAPALQVEVAGVDCRAAPLAAFLDGSAKFLLHVTAPASVAPLARLIAPRSYVVQTSEPDALRDFVAHAGWGVAALVPEGCARFCYVPHAAGADGRLETEALPEAAPRRVGGSTPAQQAEDLEILRAWRRAPGSAPVEGHLPATDATPDASADPAGQLATWLLRQSGLAEGA